MMPMILPTMTYGVMLHLKATKHGLMQILPSMKNGLPRVLMFMACGLQSTRPSVRTTILMLME